MSDDPRRRPGAIVRPGGSFDVVTPADQDWGGEVTFDPPTGPGVIENDDCWLLIAWVDEGGNLGG
jgi:hypothetical protein